MTLARLVAAALVICSLPTFAQDQQSQSAGQSIPACNLRSAIGCPTPGNVKIGGNFFFDLGDVKTATPSEPWRIFQNPLSDAPFGQILLDPIRLSQVRLDEIKDDPRIHHLKLFFQRAESDTICYVIRSYVVSRDSKDSDSTHAAGYSTCQPSSRYRVKTTEMRSVIEYR
jgi:hypothetical protein